MSDNKGLPIANVLPSHVGEDTVDKFVPPGEPIGQISVVRHQNENRILGRVEFGQQFSDRLSGPAIKVSGRFIRQQ